MLKPGLMEPGRAGGISVLIPVLVTRRRVAPSGYPVEQAFSFGFTECGHLRPTEEYPDGSANTGNGGPDGLLISASKVRVLDGPPMITGASDAPDARADFPSSVLIWATRKTQ
jgi:hypothetical protein